MSNPETPQMTLKEAVKILKNLRDAVDSDFVYSEVEALSVLISLAELRETSPVIPNADVGEQEIQKILAGWWNEISVKIDAGWSTGMIPSAMTIRRTELDTLIARLLAYHSGVLPELPSDERIRASLFGILGTVLNDVPMLQKDADKLIDELISYFHPLLKKGVRE
jgi:hypothetical protein